MCSKEFWGEATRLGAQYRFGEWVEVAELVMVMVPGSVEDERKFSTFKYICKTPAQQATSAAPDMLRTGV